MTSGSGANGDRNPGLQEREVKALEAIAQQLRDISTLMKLTSGIPEQLKLILQELNAIASRRSG